MSLKDVIYSEKILKIKSLLKEGFEINELKENIDYSVGLQLLDERVESTIHDGKSVSLREDTKEVSNYIAGYIAHKMTDTLKDCCHQQMIDCLDDQNNSYTNIVSRGGLKYPSISLANFIANGFAILDSCSEILRTSTVPARLAGEYVLSSRLTMENFFCEFHESSIHKRAITTICNIFFNNQRKRNTETVRENQVMALKRQKRLKQ